MQRPSRWRERCVAAVTLLIWLVLAGRLFQVQFWQREAFASRAARQQTLEERIAARPGDIYDRRGRLLATTMQVQSLYVVPDRVDDPWDLARRLAEAIHLDTDDLLARIESARERHFVWIKRRLSDEEVAAVRALSLPDELYGFRPEYQRRYPQGPIAAHVLGLRDIDGVARGGVEEGLDPLLHGTDGQRELVRDARGYVLAVRDDAGVMPRDGQAVTLTLDSVIQLFVERELDHVMAKWEPLSACAIVIEPGSGDVLAMGSRPAFDPNDPSNVPEAAWSNTAVTTMFEPGSTFKPMIVAWALDHGALREDEEFDCERGAYRMGRRTLHDHHAYGVLSVTDILVKSSNIGMAKIGERLGNDGLYAAATAYGFGRRTGIELPGELPGLLRPLNEWTSYSTGSIPMGQELAATPLQVIAAHAALANDGRMVSPHLLLTIPEGSDYARNVVSAQIATPESAQWLVRTAMVQVVQRGTGQKARIDGVDVFGKSGTAQKIDPATGQYSTRRHVSAFVCGAPADDPRVLVLVSVNEPTQGGSDFGGTVAAPSAAAILQETLGYLQEPERSAATGTESKATR
jgi:cell division protein FtsI/penicillin-binding protein 2